MSAAFERIGEKTNIKSACKLLYIVVKISGFFFIIEDKNMVCLTELPYACCYKVDGRASQVVEVDPHWLAQRDACRQLFQADIILIQTQQYLQVHAAANLGEIYVALR